MMGEKIQLKKISEKDIHYRHPLKKLWLKFFPFKFFSPEIISAVFSNLGRDFFWREIGSKNFFSALSFTFGPLRRRIAALPGWEKSQSDFDYFPKTYFCLFFFLNQKTHFSRLNFLRSNNFRNLLLLPKLSCGDNLILLLKIK